MGLWCRRYLNCNDFFENFRRMQTSSNSFSKPSQKLQAYTSIKSVQKLNENHTIKEIVSSLVSIHEASCEKEKRGGIRN